MRGKRAGLAFLAVCVVLAILLLTRVISIFTSSIVFAAALVLAGLLSRGFSRA